MGELQLRAFHKQFGMSGIACRIFTAYGERENETHAVVALIAKAIVKMDPFPIWGSGLQTRNFTYVADTVTGMALAGAKLKGFDTINVGSSHHYTILDLCEEIFDHLGWRPEIIEKQLNKPVGVRSRASDNTKCRELLGWEPSHSLREGVKRTTDFYAKSVTQDQLKKLETLLMERN
jgi:UDP-glucose 4-epimerase